MISTALSDNGSGTVKTRFVGQHNDLFVPGLYKNELHRTWSTGLLYAIILFFAIPVVVLLYFTSNEYMFTEYPERVTSFLSEYLSGQNPFNVIYGCLGGMMCAMVVAEYLFDRRKTNFVCSLPVKRGAYLITKASANLTWSVLAWIPAIVLMILVTAVTAVIRPYFTMVLGGLFSMFGAWLCAHLYFFGLTLLACCFCGTGVMAGCMVLMLGGYIPVLALSLIGFADLTFGNIWSSWYLSEPLFDAISGVFRIFHYCMAEMTFFYYLGTALLGLLFVAGAVLLTVKRKSEFAGTPFAFERVRDIVKYLLVALAALLGGMLFHVMSDGVWSIIWLVFGCVCGAVIAWMLCNTIFYKTPKMMFEGKRGVAIVAAVMIVYSLCFRFDVLDFDNYVPSNVMTHKIEMQVDGAEIEFEDRSLIRLYNAMLKNGYKTYDQYGYAATVGNAKEIITADSDTSYIDTENRLIRQNTVWYTRYLLPVAKRTYARNTDWAAFVSALTAMPDFADLYTQSAFDALKEAERKDERDIRVRYSEAVYGDTPLVTRDLSLTEWMDTKAVRTILEAYREEMRSFGADAMQKQYTGTISVRFNEETVEIPLFLPYETTRATVLTTFKEAGYDPEQSDYSYVENDYVTTRSFIKATVYKNGKVIDTVTEEELSALFSSECISYDTGYNANELTVLDQEYAILVTCDAVERYVDYREKYNYEYDYSSFGDGEVTVNAIPEPTYTTENETTYTEETVYRFFFGKVPTEYLG